MKVRDKKTVHIRVTKTEREAVARAAKLARQSSTNYVLQAIAERMQREGKEWPESK